MQVKTDDDWEAILSFLPEDWKEQAKQLGAFTRARCFDIVQAKADGCLKLNMHIGWLCAIVVPV